MKKIILFGAILAAMNFAHAHSPEEMLQIVNEARSQSRTCGGKRYAAAPPFELNAALQRAAQKHADDMAKKGYFSHHSRDGRTPFQRMEAEGYRYWTAGENIAKGHRSAESAVAGWLKSAGHCANIMNPEFHELGMAQNGTIWVQTFGKPR